MSRTIVICLLLSLPLVAQDPPPVPNPANPAGNQANPNPVDPAGNPANPNPGNPANPNPGNPAPGIPGLNPPQPGANPDPVDPPPAPGRVVIPNAPDPNLPATLNAANLTGQDIAELYHQYTGKRVLVSQEAASGEVSFIVPGQMTYSQAARIIEKKLVMEGFELVPDDDDPSLVKLVLANSQSSGVKALGAPIVGSVEDLEQLVQEQRVSADGFVTFVMPLVYLKPDDALRAFQSVVQQFGSAGTVAAVPNAGSLVISGNLPLVRMLVELKERIDVPSAQVGTKFVEITYADVEDLADRLNEIFNNQRQTQQSARVQRTSTPAANTPPTPITQLNPRGAAAGGGGTGSAGEDTPINIIAQPRTSRIFLMGRPSDIIFVEGLIADFDTPSSKRNFLRRKLQYLPVTEFIPVAADALERTLETSATGGGGGARRSTGTTGRNTGITGRNQAGNTGRNTFGANNTGGIGGGIGGGRSAQIAQQDIQTAPESILIGKTLLVGDNISNSVVVNGPPHHIEIVEELVNELDQPSEQIAISAVFASYSLSKNRTFGMDFAQLIPGGRDFTGGVQNRGFANIIDPDTIMDLGDLIASQPFRGLNAYARIGDNFGLFVNALETNSNFTSIARPTVFTTNNGRALISSGKEIAIPTGQFFGGTTGNSTNFEQVPVVLSLQVTPLVNSENEVTLDIALVRDGVGEDRTFGEGDDAVTIPDINSDEITTRVTVPNKSTVILGGLITEEDTKGGDGIPILRSLPGVGPLFGSKSDDKRRSELVIMIHPSILNTKEEVASYQRDYDAKSQVAPKARASFEGSGVLPPRGAYRPNGNGGAVTPNAGAPALGRPAVPVQPSPAKVPMMTSPSHRAMWKKNR